MYTKLNHVTESPVKPTVSQCPSCRVPQKEPVDHCPDCSFPYQASQEERKKFLDYRRNMSNQYAAARHKIRIGSNILIILGIIGALQTFIIFGTLKGEVQAHLFYLSLILSVFLAAVYTVSGVLARNRGLVFITIGTVTYFGETMFALLAGINLISVVKIGFLVALIFAFIGAINAHQTQQQIAQVLGPRFMDRLKKWEE